MSSNEEIDIDLNDPEVQKAALKIQHQFKGFKIAKKSVKVEKEQTTEQTPRKEDRLKASK
ncbi:hypothetical protein Smp_155290 [Schistosoma mansoni]|uniref:hypothetical protein n=1 Tax=Schistosoma mansoni TaxID=6183 RepID=UPI0001A6368D|nr:hypothetical protein Smp_155290 [Schistosoma mansoni]|eukprot:XP_018644993.1 hypothetical protein Smp_155290 [Schistosoma mansoni]